MVSPQKRFDGDLVAKIHETQLASRNARMRRRYQILMSATETTKIKVEMALISGVMP